MDRLEAALQAGRAKTAVIVGGGFIGIEMAEAFAARGLRTTVVEMAPALMSMMDAPFGRLVEEELARHGVEVVTGTAVVAIDPEKHEAELRDGRRIPADLVLFAVGVRPELELAKQAGLQLGETGALAVSESLVTSDPDILAAGDMVEVTHRVHGRKVRVPLAGPANRQGRIAATVAAGLEATYNGVLGTSIVKVVDRTAGSTGLSERAALAAGFDAGLAVIHKEHHATYFPGAKEMTLALVYDRATHRLLGAQAFGEAGIESRINTLAVALAAGQTVEEIAELDLVYAPPYSSANDPVNLAAFVAVNDLTGFSPLVTAASLRAELATEAAPLVVDVRSASEWAAGHVTGSRHLPLDEMIARASELPRDRRIVVTCRAGYRGHLALRTLRGLGFEHVRNLTGGFVSVVQDGGFAVEVSR
jgi:rhodanese-related sulfurtransferase